jgi:hypothetical protein
MTLAEVRRRLRPLLPEPGTVLFPAPNPDTPPVAPPPKPSRPAGSLSKQFAPPKAPVAPTDTPLASDPGPLPFMVTNPPAQRPSAPRKRRGKLATVVLALVAAIIVVLSMSGGFVLTRYLGGQALVPPAAFGGTATSQPAGTSTVAPVATTPTQGNAVTQTGSTGGNFTVDVPQGWQEFKQTRDSTDSLPSRAQIFYISPDGSRELSVQRFPKFTKVDAYINAVRLLPKVTLQPVVSISVSGFTQAQRLDYTQDISAAAPSTVAMALVKGNDLWVVGVKAPVDDPVGKLLFNQIYQQFQVTG